MPSLPSRPKRLKIISVNMCIASSGLQNKILPTLCVAGGITFGAIIFSSLLVALLYASNLPTTTALAVLVVCVPFICFISFAFGARVGGVIGSLHTFITGRHDHKVARLHSFAEALKDFDVLLLQELYTAKPLWLDRRFDNIFIDLCKDKGFSYVARPAAAKLPSICMGTGLMILSKHPILTSETLPFKNQYFAEQFGVNRGMMYAQVSVKDDDAAEAQIRLVDLFTLHTTASMAEALLKGAPSFLINMAEVRGSNSQGTS